MQISRLLAAAALAVAPASMVHAQSAATAPAKPSVAAPAAQAAAAATPVLTVEQQKAFLKSAEIRGGKTTSKGVTRPSRVTLSDGTLTHDAAFQSVDERKAVANLATRTELNFRDYWGYNIAAHELACLIRRCDLVPAAVERSWRGETGSLVWWVDDVKMDEGDRVKNGIVAPNQLRWVRQMLLMRLFTELTADTDRNRTNILITSDWRVVLIDFTRAFRLTTDLKAANSITAVERDVFDAMKAMTRDQLAERTERWLTGGEIDAVMERRDKLVAHFEALAAKKGERAVIYPAPAATP
jgi:hypothetical protein